MNTNEQKIEFQCDVPRGVDFHPTLPLLAVALISGTVSCYRHSEEGETDGTYQERHWPKVLSSEHHTEGVRCVRFSGTGSQLYSGSVDRSIKVLDVSTKEVVLELSEAHEDAVNCVLPLEGAELVVSGDDSGNLKLLDMRAGERIAIQPHTSLILSLAQLPGTMQIAAASGDGQLTVHDFRGTSTRLVYQMDEWMDDEMTGVVVGPTCVYAGCADGKLFSFAADWESSVRRLKKIRGITAMARHPRGLLLGGGEGEVGIYDGQLRQVGKHESKMEVESVASAQYGGHAASCASDGVVQIWQTR